MNLEERIEALHQLGEYLANLNEEELDELTWKAGNQNSWFTPEHVQRAISGIRNFLDRDVLKSFTSNYQLSDQHPAKTIGIVMAGNIPLVGFHDLLCVLLSGNRALIKPSSTDTFLMRHITDKLIEIDHRLVQNVLFAEKLEGMDAIIATGSDNTARYFEYYFAKYPHIIRKNRTSIGILNGSENAQAFESLGKDIFLYFGLGCRNVSKLYVPQGYNFSSFFEAIEDYKRVRDHHKYVNNYDYNKSIYLINGVQHLDNGFLLVTASESLVSPISVLYFEEYSDGHQLKTNLENQADKIQCIVSDQQWWPNSFDFGQAQSPAIDDYADQVDTMQFLTSL